MLKSAVQRLLAKGDLHLGVRSHSVNARRVAILRHLGVSHFLDIGANEGQYAEVLRRWGYTGEIVSVEPVSAPFTVLTRLAHGDTGWRCVKAAVGREPGELTLNVSENSLFSSALPVTDTTVAADPRAAYVSQETVRAVTLDDLLNDLSPNTTVGVKIDVQGLEDAVLDGGPETLRQARFVELELSFVPIYEGEAALLPLVERMYGAGFRLGLVENVLPERGSGIALQMNGVFVRG